MPWGLGVNFTERVSLFSTKCAFLTQFVAFASSLAIGAEEKTLTARWKKFPLSPLLMFGERRKILNTRTNGERKNGERFQEGKEREESGKVRL